MGYSYSASGHIVCDGCGRTGGGTRKRTCPVSWCPPPAYCSGCFAERGKTRGLHDRCAAPAAEYAAEQAAERAKVEAGDLLVACGWGSWADWVPEGWVGVDFDGLNGRTQRVLMPEADYCQRAFTFNEYCELTDVRLVAA